MVGLDAKRMVGLDAKSMVGWECLCGFPDTHARLQAEKYALNFNVLYFYFC